MRGSAIAKSLRQLLFLATLKLGHFAPFAERQEPCFSIGKQLCPGVGNVEVAHGELAYAVARGETGFSLLHAEAPGMKGEVGRFGVQNGVVIAAAQLKRDLA